MDLRIRNKLEKLLALAEQGIGGEKDNAARILEKLMLKHDISMAQLTDDHREMHWFKYGRGFNFKRLMTQIIYSHNISAYTSPGHKARLGAKVTASERMEIELKFSAFSSSLKEQEGILFLSFIHKHRLFSEKSGQEEKKEEPSLDELARIRRIAAMMMTMPDVTIRTGIESDG